MFSFLNWFSTAPTPIIVQETSSPLPQIPSTPSKIHILSDMEYHTIVDRLKYLESLVDNSSLKVDSNNNTINALPKVVHPSQDALHKELTEKIKQIRINMGESHGFTRDDAINMYDVEKSICIE